MAHTMTVKAAQVELGISGTSFWRLIWKAVEAGELIVIRYSPKLVRFDPKEIAALKKKHEISCPADLGALTDGRRAANRAAARSLS